MTSFFEDSLIFCFDQSIGPSGLTQKDYDFFLMQGESFLREWQKKEDYPLFKSLQSNPDWELLHKAVNQLAAYDEILVLGTGGSSLGGQTLQALGQKNKPHLIFLDNIDPSTCDHSFKKRDWKKTGLIIISKSGETAETLLQFLVALKEMRHFIDDSTIKNHCVVITEKKASSLQALANHFNLLHIPHDPHIGGRYSVFSSVGLLPALLMGLNIEGLKRGGLSVLNNLQKASSPDDISSLRGAALQMGLLQKHSFHQSVIFPYLDQLERFSAWYAQLWAESLGKNGKGLTPVRAIGAVDQHSQLQLYLDGPKDKFFTLLIADQRGLGGKAADDLCLTPILEELSNKTIGDLMEAEQKATYETLAQNGCPTRLIRFKSLNEEVMGALLMHFMLETIFMASYLNINAFDQPAVEQGKILARTYLKDDYLKAA